MLLSFEHLYSEAVKSTIAAYENVCSNKCGIDTLLTHGGHEPTSLPDMGNPVIPPITMSATFQQIEPATGKYDYSRSGNYSRDCLEKCINGVENGASTFVFSSGLAALGASLNLLSAGDHVLAFDDLYGGTGRYFRNIGTKNCILFSFVDMRNPESVKAMLKPSTKMVFIETPSNPLMRLVDIKEVSRIAHEFNPSIIVVVDNTFMTPHFQRPLELGADISLSSLTKYMNGHSDVVMGSLAVRKGLPEIVKQIKFTQFAAGAVPSPFDCFLCLRGLRTLAVRMRTHMRNGLTVAHFLDQHPSIEAVIHPGLPSHPQHSLALQQMSGFSGMICAYLKVDAKKTTEFAKGLKYFALAESLGGFESLIEIPSLMTHASVPIEQRALLGITDNMVRISVGLEDPRDLAFDLHESLQKL